MENIKWIGGKQEFLEFAKDYVITIHESCKNPKDQKDLELREKMKDLDIQIIGTVNGEDVLEIRFVKKPITPPHEEPYQIIINDVANFRVQLMTMIEKVKFNIDGYANSSSSEIAEKFEHKINSFIKK